MNPATDMLRTAETLREAGVADHQAKAHARALEDAAEALVTREHLRAEMATMRDALTWRLLGGVGLLLTLFELARRFLPPA